MVRSVGIRSSSSRVIRGLAGTWHARRLRRPGRRFLQVGKARRGAWAVGMLQQRGGGVERARGATTTGMTGAGDTYFVSDL